MPLLEISFWQARVWRCDPFLQQDCSPSPASWAFEAESVAIQHFSCVFKLTSSHHAGFRGTAPLVRHFCDRESLLLQPFQQLCKYIVPCIKSLSAKTPRRVLVSCTKPLLRQKLLSLSFLQKRKLKYREINLFPPRSQSTKWQSQDLNPKAISFCYPPLNKITQSRVASRTQEGKTAFIYQPTTT